MTTSLQPVPTLVPGASLEAYVHSVNSIPLLTPERERELAERLFYKEDVEAARQLVLAHLRFVVHIAKSYSGYGLAQADLVQEGNVGLMKAVKRFNPEMGVRLVSFAVHWIKAEIHEFILRNWRIVKGRHHQGAAQVVLQPAQSEETTGLAEQRRGPSRGRNPGCRTKGSA